MEILLDKERTFAALVWLSDLESLEGAPPAVLKTRLGEKGFLVEGLEELLEELKEPVPERILENIRARFGATAEERARRLVRCRQSA